MADYANANFNFNGNNNKTTTAVEQIKAAHRTQLEMILLNTRKT